VSDAVFRVPARRAKKRLGQHFLRDGGVTARIVGLAAPLAGAEVLEIGPGEGVLTAALLAAGARVTAIETDRDLFAPLQERFRAELEQGSFRLLEGDFLKLDLAAALAGREPVAVVANIPYQITTPIIFRLIRERRLFSRAVLMMQEEVAARLTAVPGSRDYGRLTVGVGLFCDLQPGFKVNPAAFSPPPRVWSRVLRLEFLTDPRYPVSDFGLLERLLLALFGQRRKQIINPLKGIMTHLTREELAARLEGAGFSPQIRPDQLAPEELVRLANSLAAWRN
jgi:16S rRNA (adenine1518-N6/adenine1519-N6)-dimethyltransferase